MTDLDRAIEILRRGGLVAFPTETVYGLGADASDRDALELLYAVKGRPRSHPVIVHIASIDALDGWALDVPSVARVLGAALWPGPLTLVLRRAARVPDEATGGLDTVGVRVPAHPLALDLLREFDGGLAAPSANRFGRVSPTTAEAVRADLGTDVDLVLDGGPCRVGVESTIVDCSTPEVRILRQGEVTRERIRDLIGVEPLLGGSTRAPGTLAAHYAPTARVVLIEPDVAVEVEALLPRAGVIGLAAQVAPLPSALTRLATPADAIEYAHSLYSALRAADAMGLDVVYAILPPVDGIGAAIRDRLSRAAASH